MNTNFQFTRYLYEKEEVELSLLINMLNKDYSTADFWAYELYYSGFKNELIELIWKIYYDFYAILNPSFEKYLLNKLKNCSFDNDALVSNIINNLMLRPYSLDVFLMRQFVNQFDFDDSQFGEYRIKDKNSFELLKRDLFELLDSEDYNMISYLVLKEIKHEHLLDLFESILTYFVDLGTKIDKNQELLDYKKINKNIHHFNMKRIILLSKIICYYGIYKNKNNQFTTKKYISICMEDEDIIAYKSKCVDLQNKEYNKAYKILPLVATHEIDNKCYLSVFSLKRDKMDIRNAYLNNWLYYASFTPIWLERICFYKGSVDHIKQKVIFETDDDEEEFYKYYGYEPDEQKVEVQNKSIQKIEKKNNWLTIYKDKNNNCILDIDTEMIKDLFKLIY
jgi:hypothetical protein